jgi:hypothetical protein
MVMYPFEEPIIDLEECIRVVKDENNSKINHRSFFVSVFV